MRKNVLLLLVLLSLTVSSICASPLSVATDPTPLQTKPGDCSAKLKQLIVTCPNFKNPFWKELSARIEKQEGEVYTIALFVKSTGGSSENPVGLLKLDVKNKTLVDITYDPDDGVVLKYDKVLYDGYLSDCLKVK